MPINQRSRRISLSLAIVVCVGGLVFATSFTPKRWRLVADAAVGLPLEKLSSNNTPTETSTLVGIDSYIKVEVLNSLRRPSPQSGPTPLSTPTPVPGADITWTVEPSYYAYSKTPPENPSVITIRITYVRPNGQGVPDAQVLIQNPRSIPFSGGHNHDDAQRDESHLGTLTPQSGLTNANGIIDFTYTAPVVSGWILADVFITPPFDSGLAFSSFKVGIDVRVEDLSQCLRERTMSYLAKRAL